MVAISDLAPEDKLFFLLIGSALSCIYLLSCALQPLELEPLALKDDLL
jgi:hypothetical protein